MSFGRIDHAGGAVVSALAAPITSSDPTCTLTLTTGWSSLGANGPFYISIYELVNGARLNEEKIEATTITGSTLNGLTRGVDGTSASDHVLGSVVEHVFTAVEADEANNTVHQTLGAIAAKGDMLTGGSANTLVKTTVGSDLTIPHADSSQPGGIRYGPIVTADITDANITGAKVANNTLTEAKMSSAFWQRNTFSITAGATGVCVIPHGASFTPTFYQIMFTSPIVTGHFVGGWVQYAAPDSTNVTVRVTAAADTGGLVASGQTLAGIILSFA